MVRKAYKLPPNRKARAGNNLMIKNNGTKHRTMTAVATGLTSIRRKAFLMTWGTLTSKCTKDGNR